MMKFSAPTPRFSIHHSLLDIRYSFKTYGRLVVLEFPTAKELAKYSLSLSHLRFYCTSCANERVVDLTRIAGWPTGIIVSRRTQSCRKKHICRYPPAEQKLYRRAPANGLDRNRITAVHVHVDVNVLVNGFLSDQRQGKHIPENVKLLLPHGQSRSQRIRGSG
jgi:hypothetical protein